MSVESYTSRSKARSELSNGMRYKRMNNRGKLVWCVVGLLCGGVVLGHTSNYTSVVPGSEWSEWMLQTEEKLSAVLLLSDNPDEVLRSWTKPEARVSVHTADTIARGTPIVAFVFFTACKSDENGLCNASADFTILRPDGSVYERFADRDLWKGKPAPPDGMLRLSAEYVGAIIEAGDPLGRYEVQVTVHDLNAGTTLELSRSFTATAE
jgi:hypothetical protein